MKKTLFTAASAAVLMTLLSGCITVILPEDETPKTSVYDITLPDSFRNRTAAQLPFTVEVERVSSTSPAKFKMLIEKGGAAKADEFNKWVQTPSAMLVREYRNVFTPKTDAKLPTVLLYATILAFDWDADTNSAVMEAEYTAYRADSDATFAHFKLNNTVPLAGKTHAAFAKAMSQAMADQITALETKLDQEWKKQPQPAPAQNTKS